MSPRQPVSPWAVLSCPVGFFSSPVPFPPSWPTDQSVPSAPPSPEKIPGDQGQLQWPCPESHLCWPAYSSTLIPGGLPGLRVMVGQWCVGSEGLWNDCGILGQAQMRGPGLVSGPKAVATWAGRSMGEVGAPPFGKASVCRPVFFQGPRVFH